MDEDHASWEAPAHPDVLAYQRAIKIAKIVVGLGDFQRDYKRSMEVILFATRKLTIPIVYTTAVLSKVASDEVLDAFQRAIGRQDHPEARREIAKHVLIRYLCNIPAEERFSALITRLGEITEAFDADFDIYASDFNFDKAREEFERKKLDFVVKINTASADVMNKLIAIPVGQGLLASQMKTEPSLAFVNSVLLTGSLVFALIGVMVIVNQRETLVQVREELKLEKQVLQQKAPPTYDRLRGMISALERRLCLHIRLVPIALVVLLLITSAVTVIAYIRATTNTPFVAGAEPSIVR